MMSLAKRIVPAAVRDVLRPWKSPGKEWRRIRYNSFYRGGVVRRNGLRYRLHAREEVSRIIFVDGDVAGDETSVLLLAAPKFRFFVDIGANIGGVSVPFAVTSGLPGLAIEPASSNFNLLKNNLGMNGLAKQVNSRQLALGAENGFAAIFLSADNRGDNRLTLCKDDRESEQVAVMTLDDCLEQQAGYAVPLLIKMDVQGFEGHVLNGAAKTLLAPSLWLLEFWPEGLAAAGFSPADIFRTLVSGGHKIYELGRKPVALYPIPTAQALEKIAAGLRGDDYCNLVTTNLTLQEAGLAAMEQPGVAR